MIGFFSTVFKAVTNVSFYLEVQQKSLWQVVRFYGLFLALISLIFISEFFLRMLPTLKTALPELERSYPADLELTWNSPTLTANQPDIIVEYPSETKKTFNFSTEALAIIRQTEELPQVDSLLVVTPTTVYVQTDGKVLSKYPLTDVITVPSARITKATLPEVLTQVKDAAKTLTLLIGIFSPLLYFIGLAITRLYLFIIEAGLGYLLLRVFGSKIAFKNFAKLALCIFVPAELVSQSARLSGVDLPFSMFSFTYWVYLVIISLQLNKRVA